MFTLSLFDETPVEETYRIAFDHWLSDKRATGALQQPASVQVYRDMWDAFMAWCLAQVPPLPMTALSLRDLQAFQAARFGRRNTDLSLSPRHALRLVRLVDRVLRHHARLGFGSAPGLEFAGELDHAVVRIHVDGGGHLEQEGSDQEHGVLPGMWAAYRDACSIAAIFSWMT